MKGKRPSAFGRKSKGKEKPPPPESMEATVPRKLSDPELDERRKRFQLKFGEKRALEKRRAQVTRELNGEIKDLAHELDLLHEQLLHGEEQVKQGDLFVDGSTHALPKDQAAKTLAEVDVRSVAPKPGSHVESVTLSMGGKSVKLTQADSTAAQFVASLGEWNGMDDQTIRRRFVDWCADKGIRGTEKRDQLMGEVWPLLSKPDQAKEAAKPAEGEGVHQAGGTH